MSNKPLLDMLAVEGVKLFTEHAELTETWKNDGGNTKDMTAHELHEIANQIDNLRDLYDSAKNETDPSSFSEYIDNQGRAAIGVCVIDPIYILDNAAFNQGVNAQYDIGITDDGINPTITANRPSAVAVCTDKKVYTFGNGQVNNLRLQEKAETLNCMHDQQAVLIRNDIIILNDQGGSSINVEKENTSPTLRAESHNNEPIVLRITQDQINSEGATHGTSTGNRHGQVAASVCPEYTVRRLTPLECERLQGLPSGWTDIGAWKDESGKLRKESTDAARYKAIGNSIALPSWEYVLQRLSICCGDDTTMASLFDGIGGFPLIWERLNGEGSCLWASEIEDFPIAVTKHRFGERDNGKRKTAGGLNRRYEHESD